MKKIEIVKAKYEDMGSWCSSSSKIRELIASSLELIMVDSEGKTWLASELVGRDVVVGGQMVKIESKPNSRSLEALEIVDSFNKHKPLSDARKSSLMKKILVCPDDEFETVKYFASMLNNKKDSKAPMSFRSRRYASIEDSINKKGNSTMLFPIDDPYRDSFQDELNNIFKD